MIAVRGNVVRVSAVRPHVMRMDFVCGKCGSMAPRSMPEGRYEPPTKCVVPSCKGKFFTPERASAVTVDWQKLKYVRCAACAAACTAARATDALARRRIQEVEADQMDAGRIPRTLEVEVQGDLVDSCVPGDVVHVTGVVKAVHAEDTRLGRSKSLYLLFLQANWVSSPRRQPSASTRAAVSRGLAEEGGRAAAVEEEVGQLDTVEFSRRDMIAIQDIASQPALLELVVASLCPAIFGHEEVKLGLTLALFGGTRHGARGSGGTRTLAVRGDPHVLVVGDPGMGKSQMLQAVSALSPRGVYVCGNTTSTTGLTVTMVRDAATGEFALEAGALVLGDQGLCCIDEFDKMGAEHQALLEAMEQQSISIAKAGIVCTLSARTSVVAAANPAGGHYNRSKTVAENLRMPSPLLSRFDLIFILLDQPDVRRDQLLSEHVMALHAGSASAGGAAEDGRAHAAGLAQPASAPGGDAAGGRASLVQRLRQGSARCTDPIPAPLLRKYIAYARYVLQGCGAVFVLHSCSVIAALRCRRALPLTAQRRSKYVHPALTAEAATVLRDFFLTLRRSHRDSESVPITTRQLESLIRLAQARAKLELREVVTRSDAEDVVQLLRESMLETYTDEYGCVDFSRAGGMSMSKKVKEFVGALTKVARERGSALFTVAVGQRRLCARMCAWLCSPLARALRRWRRWRARASCRWTTFTTLWRC